MISSSSHSLHHHAEEFLQRRQRPRVVKGAIVPPQPKLPFGSPQAYEPITVKVVAILIPYDHFVTDKIDRE